MVLFSLLEAWIHVQVCGHMGLPGQKVENASPDAPSATKLTDSNDSGHHQTSSGHSTFFGESAGSAGWAPWKRFGLHRLLFCGKLLELIRKASQLLRSFDLLWTLRFTDITLRSLRERFFISDWGHDESLSHGQRWKLAWLICKCTWLAFLYPK